LKSNQYEPVDVLTYLIERVKEGHTLLVSSSSDLLLDKELNGNESIWSVRNLKPSPNGYMGRIIDQRFILSYDVRFYWGRGTWITYSELKAKPTVLQKLGIDNSITLKRLENARKQLGENNPNARSAIIRHIDAMKHIGAYPREYQERILFGAIIPKNYSLATRLGLVFLLIGLVIGAWIDTSIFGSADTGGIGMPLIVTLGLVEDSILLLG